jgi:hypothetical protein
MFEEGIRIDAHQEEPYPDCEHLTDSSDSLDRVRELLEHRPVMARYDPLPSPCQFCHACLSDPVGLGIEGK